MQTYTFHVSLPGTGRVWRKIEMPTDQTLEDLHFAIQRAYGWSADHLYSFFMSNEAWDQSSEYKLPEGGSPWEDDEFEIEDPEPPQVSPEEEEAALREFFGETDMTLEEMRAEMQGFFDDFIASEPGNVRETTLEELDLEEGQVFMYLFDYGDEWRFKVRVHAIDLNAPEEGDYPRIVESVGEAPEQYPDWE